MTFDQLSHLVAASACYVIIASIWFCGAFIAFRRKPLAGTALVGSGFLLIVGEQLLDTAGHLALASLSSRGRLPENEWLLHYQTLSYALMAIRIASALLLVTGVARIWRSMDQTRPVVTTVRDENGSA